MTAPAARVTRWMLHRPAWLWALLAACGSGDAPPGDQFELSRLVYSNEDGSFLMGTRDARPIALVAPGFAFIQDPSISPTGQRIAFTGFKVGAQAYEIYVASLGADGIEGEPTSVLRFEGSYVGEPRWSPDGQNLVATRVGPGLEVWVVGVDGASPRLLAESALQPDWSPDGQRIVYARPAGGPFRISTVAAGGGEPWDVSAGTCNEQCWSQWLPRWRPDGRLSVVHTTMDAQDLITTMDAFGRDVDTVFVTRGRQTTYGIAWSPSGERFAIARRMDDTNYQAQTDLFIVNPATRAEERLTTTPGSSEIVRDWR